MTQIAEGPDSSSAHPLTDTDPAPGEVLTDRYQLEEHINNDAYGRQVWRGIDIVLRRPVAVVLRYPGGAAAHEMLEAAVTASRVEHPHLIDVYDAIDEGSRAYVVREWVAGASLRELVLEAPLDPDRAVSVARCVAEAVAALHATGMAHGNIHPGTVLIASDGRVILTDARADAATSYDSDVRGVGAVLYCALTGYWPHAEAGEVSLPDAVRDPSGVAASPRQIRAGVPRHLSDLVSALIEGQDLPSADVLAAELRRLDAEPDDQFFGGGGPFGSGTTPYPEQSHRGRIGRKISVGVGVLLALAVGGVLLANTMLGNDGGRAAGSVVTPGTSGNGAPKQPTLLTLSPSQVRIVDPPGQDRSETRGSAAVVDGDLSTAWNTAHYFHDPNFGRAKPGMGVLIDLGSPRSVTDVQVALSAAGATVQLLGGQTDPGDSMAGDTQIVQTYQPLGEAHVDAGTNLDLTVPTDDQVRYLLVWITKLPPATDNPTEYQVGIDEIKVLVS